MARFVTLMGLLVLMVIGALLPITSADAQVRVRGYFKKDGTYVQPHYRSAPDGNPYNNWSFPGNTNPYTGEVASGDPETYLRNYYRRNGGSGSSRIGSDSSVSTTARVLVPSVEVERKAPAGSQPSRREDGAGAVLPHYVAQEDLQRSRLHCQRIYPVGSPYREPCELEQYRTLARLVLPDYSSLPKEEVGRSAYFCERVYNDNRAAFYDCVNDQILGLRRVPANFSGVESDEAARAQGFCDRVYGDNRAAAADCKRDQARGLVGNSAPNVSNLPAEEWNAADRFCERVYGDNRAAVSDCKRDQAQGLKRSAPNTADLPSSEWTDAEHFCERVYGDNRAAVLDCKRDQATAIRQYARVQVTGHVPPDEWQQALAFCERIYSTNRAAALQCRNDQARSLEAAGRRGLFGKEIDPERRSYCDRIFSGNRSAFWDCVSQR